LTKRFSFTKGKKKTKIKNMKTKSILALGFLVISSAFAFSAPNEGDSTAKQLQIFPKNLARQNVGTNLFVFNPTNKTYVPTEAAAAWLDDDIATGWPPLPGTNHYLLSLASPQLVTNLAISAKSGAGTVSIYAGDEPAAPSAKSWTLVAKDISIDSINQKTLAKPFSRFAKYLLIETNIADPSPWYSLYIYGDKPAISYHIQKREHSVDTRSIFGPFLNDQTAFNLSSIYAKARVIYSNTSDNSVSMQKFIDDNPESNLTLAPSKTESGLIVRYAQARTIQRLSILSDPSAKGRLDFYLVANLPAAAPVAAASTSQDAQFVKVTNTPAGTTAPQEAPASAVSLTGLTPTASIVLDGTSGRGSIDFPSVSASHLIIRWTPDTADQSIIVREINSFGDLSLNDYELVSDSLPPVGEKTADDSTKKAYSSDYKGGPDYNSDYKGDKGGPDPVGELLPGKTPFVPGPIGAPPLLTSPLSL
jgi:hypothetical protein